MGFRSWKARSTARFFRCRYNYWMSPKWLSSFGTAIDLGSQGNMGQSFTITRVGESFLISAGFNVDASRNSVGANLAIEPRFLPEEPAGQRRRRPDSAGGGDGAGMRNDEG